MTTNKKNKHIVVPQLGDYRALTTLGVPLVIGQIGVVLQNFADTLMIGHHTTVELAAASLVSNIFILGLLMAMGFALCLTPVIGRSFGQDDTKSIGKTTRNGMAVNTLAALFLMAFYTVFFSSTNWDNPKNSCPTCGLTISSILFPFPLCVGSTR